MKLAGRLKPRSAPDVVFTALDVIKDRSGGLVASPHPINPIKSPDSFAVHQRDARPLRRVHQAPDW